MIREEQKQGQLELQVENEMEEAHAVGKDKSEYIEQIFAKNPKIERIYAKEYIEKINKEYIPKDIIAYEKMLLQ